MIDMKDKNPDTRGFQPARVVRANDVNALTELNTSIKEVIDTNGRLSATLIRQIAKVAQREVKEAQHNCPQHGLVVHSKEDRNVAEPSVDDLNAWQEETL